MASNRALEIEQILTRGGFMNDRLSGVCQDGYHQIQVLVVDDVPDVARAISEMLSSCGFIQTQVALSGREALEKLNSSSIDVVISDIMMPKMDGIQLLKRIREFNLDIPIILLTGGPNLESARRAVELGAFRYLTKPVSHKVLIDVVKKASFSLRMAELKRKAFRLAGMDDNLPGDLAGLSIAFEQALEKLWMAYQPIVSSNDNSLFAYEVLIRSDSKLLSNPGALLEAMERLNRVNLLGRIVRRKIVEPLTDLSEAISVFINLHPLDLLDSDLTSLASPIAQMANRIVFEITERNALEGIANVQQTIKQLRGEGYRIAVDDLGSGYSGLTSFATLEPDFVKLDMSLTRDANQSLTKQKLIQSICRLCHDLGVMVVAEGIESEPERQICGELGCDLLQGYLIAKPGRPFPIIH
jgi:EAL domain-containing protein (putative c-di-GMP-specific phosphodiesterase class I)